MLALAWQNDPEVTCCRSGWLSLLSIRRIDFIAARSRCERALALVRDMRSSASVIAAVTFSPPRSPTRRGRWAKDRNLRAPLFPQPLH
jgi:hypothetical protein